MFSVTLTQYPFCCNLAQNHCNWKNTAKRRFSLRWTEYTWVVFWGQNMKKSSQNISSLHLFSYISLTHILYRIFFTLSRRRSTSIWSRTRLCACRTVFVQLYAVRVGECVSSWSELALGWGPVSLSYVCSSLSHVRPGRDPCAHDPVSKPIGIKHWAGLAHDWLSGAVKERVEPENIVKSFSCQLSGLIDICLWSEGLTPPPARPPLPSVHFLTTCGSTYSKLCSNTCRLPPSVNPRSFYFNCLWRVWH